MGRKWKLKRKRNVVTNARQLVQVAREKGMTYQDIAEKCDVSVGSVKRWVSTGRADKNRIRPLEMIVGQTFISPEAVANVLIENYKQPSRKRYRLSPSQLRKISGRTVLGREFLKRLLEHMLGSGYHFIETVESGEDVFVVISNQQLLTHVPRELSDKDLSAYYQSLAEGIEDDDDEEGDDQ